MMRDPVDWPTRDLLAHRAAATPDRTALVDVATGQEWSYGALDALVDGLTARLRASLDDAVRVGTLTDTRVEFAATFHASLRAGATVVPLNVRLTERELEQQLERIQPDGLVCEETTEERAVAAADCPVLTVDDTVTERTEKLPIDNGSPGGERAAWDRNDTAVLLFTSGTTGEPKCVRLTLGNIVASATASAFRLGIAPGDRWLDCLPVYHMGGLAPICRCPLYGTTLLVQEGFEAGATGDALARHNGTGVSLVPTQLKRLLDGGWQPDDPLKTVLLGGAPASEELITRALERDVPVHPTYGLTEAASQVATATPALAREQPASVGQPLVFTDVTIVGDDGSPVPAGQTGELVVDGPTVTPGYLDDHQSAAAIGEYGLRTGDVGSRDEDGHLRVFGRLDDTIITGGENVHPSEVRSVLCDHPRVDDAAVVGLTDAEWGERVAALVVGDGLTPGDVERFARDHLAGYKIPRTVAVGPDIPRTASGTVDRERVRGRLADHEQDST